MPCATTHRLINFAATAGFLASRADSKHPGFIDPLLGGTVSAVLASLPDAIEPAIYPHHRQFFHSLVFAGAVGYGLHEAYHWHPATPFEELLRMAVLFVGSAYLLHLAADLLTARSLPLIGK